VKNRFVLPALALVLVFAAARPAAAQNQKPVPKPDLVLTSFGLASWGTSCQAGQTLFTFSVGVKNQGNASWTGPDRPVVVVADMHLPNPDTFGTGMAVDPPLAPGQTRQMSIPVLFDASNPGHLKSGAPHPFQATVNRDHKIAESDFSNNAGPGPAVWKGLKVIQVGVPEACLKTTKAGPPAGPGPATGRVAPPAPTPTLVPIR
jgi:hypothetical protein